jgi:hypothetical protein
MNMSVHNAFRRPEPPVNQPATMPKPKPKPGAPGKPGQPGKPRPRPGPKKRHTGHQAHGPRRGRPDGRRCVAGSKALG